VSGGVKAPASAARACPASPASFTSPVALAALALAVLVAASYFPATRAGFVWDDVVLTGAKPLQSASGLWQIWFDPRSLSDYEGHYWPILYTTFWLENRLWGTDPLGYHVVNLLLHTGVTLLLWRLLRRLAVPGAWLAAAVFAVHPLHVEPVVWVIGRKDLLAAAFYLAAALNYLRFVERQRRRHYGYALALFTLGLLCKSIIVTLPVALLIWHWGKQGRVTGADVARVAPLLLVGLCLIAADLAFYKHRDPTAFDYSPLERALIAGQALWFHAGKLVWPAGLSVIYPKWEVGTGNATAWAGLFGAGAVVTGLWAARRRIGRGALAGVLLFALTLSPTLGFVDYGYMLFSFVADRYQYLAGAALIAVLVGAASHGARRLPERWQILLRAPAAIALLILGALTWQQAGIYRNNTTFYTHITALNPQARLAHNNLGLEHYKAGRYEEALAAYRTEQRLARDHPDDRIRNSRAHLGIGQAVEALGRLDQAADYYQRALQIAPRFTPALEYLGALRIRQTRYAEALDLFRQLLNISPGVARFHVGEGVALAGLNRPQEALQSYQRALALDPSLQQARTNRDNLLKFMQRNGG